MNDTSLTSLPSPCISVCKMNPATGRCLGCYRSRAEIKGWRDMDVAAQKALVGELQMRRAVITGRSRRPARRPSSRDATSGSA